MPPDATLDLTLRLVTVMVVTVAENIAVGSSTAGINGCRLFKAVCASSTYRLAQTALCHLPHEVSVVVEADRGKAR